MKLVLKITGPDGVVTELPVDDARLEVIAQPGHRYQLEAESPQPLTASGAPATPAEAVSPRALRIEDDLVLDQLPAGYPVLLNQFFANCTAQASCELVIDVPGAQLSSITPLTEPLAAYAEGGFLMYTASPMATAALPAAPESESSFNWRPFAALGGAVAIAGSAGGGGNSVATDAAAGTPQITGGTETNSSTPVFTGTADPGSSVRLSIQITGDGATSTVGYATQADSAGNWTINTLTDIPTSGQFPVAGIQAGQDAVISVVSTNAAGTISPVVNDVVVIDTVAPERPVLNGNDDLNPSVSAELNGISVVNAGEAADGVVVDGTAEAGSTVTLMLTGAGNFALTEQVVADDSGQFSLTLEPAALPADGELSLTAAATDSAGNTGAPTQIIFLLDQSLSDAVVGVTSITDDRAPGIGDINGATNDTTPTITGSLVGALAADEQIQLLRDGNIAGTADVTGATWSFTDNLNASEGGAQGNYVYTAQIADYAGNSGNGGALGLQSSGLAVSVDTTPPNQVVTIASVIDDDGPVPVQIDRGGVSDDMTPTIQVSLSDVLAAGESLQLVRSQNGSISLIGSAVDDDASGELTFAFEDNLSGAGSVVVYQAQVVDAAGLASSPSLAYSIQLLDPLDNLS